MLWDWLLDVPRGEVRLCAYADLALIDGEPPHLRGDLRASEYASNRWLEFPPIEQAIDEIVLALAQRAFALWPRWYGLDSNPQCSDIKNANSSFAVEWFTSQPKQPRLEISKSWLHDAASASRTGRLPLFSNYPQAVQVAQLSLTLGPDHLLILLIVESPRQPEGRLLGLARVGEWLANHTGAAVAVMIPGELANHPELTSLLDVWRPTIDPLFVKGIEPEEDRIALPPLEGRPHPFSPGEQRLAEMLAHDDELAELFVFNQKLTTTRDNRLMVDLLWKDGGLVVEIDGYRHHGNRSAFIQDRQRDYELLISGYQVLRIPHDEVMHDAQLALEKIRDVVRFRRKAICT